MPILKSMHNEMESINPLNAELNPICHLLVLIGANPILHVSRIKVNIIGLHYNLLLFSEPQQLLVGQGNLIIEASRSQTSQSVGLLWMNDRPGAETST
jgi:hypothetical protein